MANAIFKSLLNASIITHAIIIGNRDIYFTKETPATLKERILEHFDWSFLSISLLHSCLTGHKFSYPLMLEWRSQDSCLLNQLMSEEFYYSSYYSSCSLQVTLLEGCCVEENYIITDSWRTIKFVGEIEAIAGL